MEFLLEIFRWVNEHGLGLLETVSIVASLGFTTASFRRDETSRRISNLLALTSAHRDIWTQILERPELARVLSGEVNLAQKPITDEEALFVTFVVLHLNATYQAMRAGAFSTKQALAEDVRWFFSRTIPKVVWEKLKPLQDEDFSVFVETAMKFGESPIKRR